MRYRRICLYIIASLVVFWTASCTHAPAEFWTSYKKENIVKQFSDQGPWGGLRWIEWESKDSVIFSENQLIRFATDEGWKVVSRIEITADSMCSWVGSQGQLTFPLLLGESDLRSDEIPRHITDDSALLKFETGMMREHPGTNEMTPAYGYVLYSLTNRRFAVYCFWGNG